MKLLLDECVTRHVKSDFIGHDVFTVDDAGFKGFQNGDLLRAASAEFDAIITVDHRLPREQDLTTFKLAVLVLIARSNRYDDLKPLVPRALDALKVIKPGEAVEIRLLQLLE